MIEKGKNYKAKRYLKPKLSQPVFGSCKHESLKNGIVVVIEFVSCFENTCNYV